MALRVDSKHGDICLVVPRRISERTAWHFAGTHRAWIETRLARMEKPVPFAHGAIIPVLGVARTIEVAPCGGRVTTFCLEEDALRVLTPRADPARNIERFLIQRLEGIVRPLAEEKAARIGKQFSGLSLRDTRTRWGSCGPDRRLMLCWRLIFAPMAVIDYVVAHEVAHLAHLNHSKRFWDVCASLCHDDMDFARTWLKDNGDGLLKYGKTVRNPAHPEE